MKTKEKVIVSEENGAKKVTGTPTMDEEDSRYKKKKDLTSRP